MGANYHGTIKWKCYNDCQQEGCPGHEATLASKHGAYYLLMNGRDSEITPDIGLMDAIAERIVNGVNA